MPHDHVDDILSKAWDVDDDLDWLVMNHFCEPIDDDKD